MVFLDGLPAQGIPGDDTGDMPDRPISKNRALGLFPGAQVLTRSPGERRNTALTRE